MRKALSEYWDGKAGLVNEGKNLRKINSVLLNEGKNPRNKSIDPAKLSSPINVGFHLKNGFHFKNDLSQKCSKS